MNQEIAKKAAKYVQDNNWVSFPELLRLLEKEGVETKGNLCMHAPNDPNLIFWTEMSNDACDIANDLTETHNIVLLSGSVMAYMADGAVQKKPLAKRAQARGFKKPHWLPVFFCRPGTEKKGKK